MLRYRKATIGDVNKLVELRKTQLIDEGLKPDKNIDSELTEFFTKHLLDDSLVEWLIEEDSKIVATGGIQFYEFPPSYYNISGIRGYISHMYTAPNYRRQGLATSLLERVVQEAKTRNVKQLFLYASKNGRPVYLKYGFEEAGEWMEMNLESKT